MLKTKQTKSDEQLLYEVSIVGISGNILLSAFKLFAGLAGHSGAMVSDAVHSLSDVFATLIAFLGVKLGERHADKEHPYGHERLECVASLILAIILAATGAGIGYSGILQLLSKTGTPAEPGILPLVAAVVSIAGKESMFWYTKACAAKLHSSVILADAWHHRSDALSSIGALIGIAGARMGFPAMDSLAGVVICLFILKIALDIFKDAIDKMTDSACPEAFETGIRACILEQKGVLGIDLLHTRMFGDKVYVDAEICIDGKLSLNEAHEIAETVHEKIEENFPTVKHVMVHMNPSESAG